ncbi:hypothetical protein HETIRDRAFT_100344 [Heterobasidion irregulare TC 32-1]|uniref:Uncharacterized protein n=1 Tax=Heterobasidion irregulare (strain TC 32-1) TaxID=747525 RepID=W4KK88_HETIT|nr:uncharacterized protein HETIRDRAFT_100344 [Heterobasidion irregulare TC 32-1]ETW86124.1 hypothetical protein HETIRDRAFT_100344 [Heterobasidion irregulare TC 32-1]
MSPHLDSARPCSAVWEEGASVGTSAAGKHRRFAHAISTSKDVTTPRRRPCTRPTMPRGRDVIAGVTEREPSPSPSRWPAVPSEPAIPSSPPLLKPSIALPYKPPTRAQTCAPPRLPPSLAQVPPP